MLLSQKMCESLPHHIVLLACLYLRAWTWGCPPSGLEGEQVESFWSISLQLTLHVTLRAPKDSQCSPLPSKAWVTFVSFGINTVVWLK